MVPEMAPAVVEVSAPILTGVAKLPAELDNWAVNTLPEVKVPEMV